MLAIRTAISVIALLIFSLPCAAKDINEPFSATILASSSQPNDVYLLRGFGDVFSRGIDEIGKKLTKRGVNNSIHSHGEWKAVLNKIVSNQKKYGRRPIVLIGHSFGANAILKMAGELKKHRVTINYMVTFAATNPKPVSSNVRKITNYYFKTDGWGKKVTPARGFRGNLQNIDFSSSKTIGHFNIEKQPRLQLQVINNVLRYIRPRKKT